MLQDDDDRGPQKAVLQDDDGTPTPATTAVPPAKGAKGRRFSAALPLLRLAREQGVATDREFVTLYIVLLNAAARGSKQWCTGSLQPFVVTEALPPTSFYLRSVPGLVEFLGGDDFLCKKMRRKSVGTMTILDVVNELALAGIKGNKGSRLVNDTLLQWSLGRRPFRLMIDKIPSPMEVLRMQAKGERVISIIMRNEAEIDKLHHSPLVYFDSGSSDHEKDSLEFAVHDLYHMDNFSMAAIYAEQVGFFKCMAGLNNGDPRGFFLTTLGLDLLLWQQLEYLISDMNAFLPHLLNYLLAKIVAAVDREVGGGGGGGCGGEKEEERIANIWHAFLDAIGMTKAPCEAREAAEAMLELAVKKRTQHLSAAEGEALRAWFASKHEL
jgi:hypothetical protein